MSYWSHFVKVGSGVFWSTCPTRCCGGSSSSGVGGSRVGPMATTFNFYQELVRNTLLMHQSLSLFSILSGIATTRTWRLSYCSFRSILHKLARSLENRVNSVKETKHLSRSERKQRRRRHARYAFHVRLKNIREECEAENSEERRAAARATLERERRGARCPRGYLTVRAPLFTAFHEIHSPDARFTSGILPGGQTTPTTFQGEVTTVVYGALPSSV